MYKRCSPCSTNRFFTVRCTQDLRRGSGLVNEHKVFFHWKKKIAARKLTANNEQCTATRSSRFRQQYFIRLKINFVPHSSCSRIVYSGLYNFIEISPSFYHNLLKTRQIFLDIFSKFLIINFLKFYELNEKFTPNFLWIFQKFSKCSRNFLKLVEDLIKFSWTFNFSQYIKIFPSNPCWKFLSFP